MIDYKKEVLEIHFNAIVYKYQDDTYAIVVLERGIGLIPLSEKMITENGAWRNAYYKLKEEGEI